MRASFADNREIQGNGSVRTGYTFVMELRRTTWEAAIRLAITMSVIAVAVAAILHTLGIAQPVIVLGVIVIGFTTSWVRTGRIVEHEHLGARRAVTVPVRGVHFPVS